MGEVTTMGLDLAKHVFQVHGVDAEGATVLRKRLRRAQVLAFFSRLAALRGWDGGVWDGALLGAGVARAWPRGATDAGEIREGVTCRATATRLSRRPVLSPLARFVRHEPTRVVWWLVSAK